MISAVFQRQRHQSRRLHWPSQIDEMKLGVTANFNGGDRKTPVLIGPSIRRNVVTSASIESTQLSHARPTVGQRCRYRDSDSSSGGLASDAADPSTCSACNSDCDSV